MSQKSITSFFKPKGESTKVVNTQTAVNEKSSAGSKNKGEKKKATAAAAAEKSPPAKCLKEESSPAKRFKEESPPANGLKEESPPAKGLKEESPTPASPLKNSSKPAVLMCFQQSLKADNTGEDYNPAKPKYHPIKDAFWQGQKNTPYIALARTFQLIEEISGRLKMIEVLGNFFSSVMLLNPDDLLPSVYLSVNQLAPAYEGIEIGVAEGSLMKIICNATGRDLKHIKTQIQETGDIGIVAEQSRFAQRRITQPQPLTIRVVFQKMKSIAKLTGAAKVNMVQDVFVACRMSEARFFIRSLVGKLRIGIAEQSLLCALALAVIKTTDSKRDVVHSSSELQEPGLKKRIECAAATLRMAYCHCPNYDTVISCLLQYGIDELPQHCRITPGIPIKPMLAQPTKSIGEILQRFEGLHITCEWKYDGERAQIHYSDSGIVSIFSRNQENNTIKYPDVTERIGQFKTPKARSFIVDSEIVAWDAGQKKILPFQILTTRKRKNVQLDDIKVKVCVYVFDLLFLNGEALVTQSFAERRKLLKENFQEVEGEWKFASASDTHDVDEIQQLLEESVKGNCEGLMIKTLDVEATYEIAKRSRNWLKLKKDYVSGVGDSLDLVVIGAYKGKGKRTGIYGGFLLACYDDENEEYQSICKIGTGFTEEDLATHTDFLKAHIIPKPKSYFRFDGSLEPDVWFDAVQVWEVKCADLSLSPIHRAAIGMIDAERGISLRFPRFIHIRDDKSPEDATSAKQIASMYSSQDQIKNTQSGTSSNQDEDFFF